MMGYVGTSSSTQSLSSSQILNGHCCIKPQAPTGFFSLFSECLPLLSSRTFAFVSFVLLLSACQLEILSSFKILCAMPLRHLYWSTRLSGLLLIHETWPWSLTVLCMVFGFFLPSNIESFLKARMRSCMLSETFINTQTWSKFRNLSWWSDWVNVKSGGRGVCWRNNTGLFETILHMLNGPNKFMNWHILFV